VIVCTFSGWVEASPTWTEKAQEVTRCLLKEIMPWFGISVSTGLNNGLAFVAEVVQLVAKCLGITWKLRIAYNPQSSGKVECMNRTLKLQLGKLCQELHLQRDQLLLTALLRIRSSPTKCMGLFPFEILFGCPLPLVKGLDWELKEVSDLTLGQQMQVLGLTLKNQ
jgi:hypothetical protein